MTSKEHKKAAVNILDTVPGDEKEKHLFRFVLDTNRGQVEKIFDGQNISLLVSDNEYMATSKSTNTEWPVEISRTLYGLSFGCKAVRKSYHRSCYENKASHKEIRFYRTENANEVWLVGEKNLVDQTVQEIEQQTLQENHENKATTDRDSDNDSPFENVEEMSLTQEEQAIMYLYRMWDDKCFQQKEVSIKKYESLYSAKIYTESENSDKSTSIEKELRHQLGTKKSSLCYGKLSFTPREIKFLSRGPVYEYVDKEVNYTRSNIRCAWYINENENTVTIFSKYQLEYEASARYIKGAFILGNCTVPAQYFLTTDAQQKMKNLCIKFGEKVDIWLSSTSSTLNFIHTKDIERSFTSELTALYVSKTLEVKDKWKFELCKNIFSSTKHRIQEKHNVELSEETRYDWKYGWNIKGGNAQVESALNELMSLLKSVCIKTKNYRVGQKIQTLQSKMYELARENKCIVTAEEKNNQVYDATDLEDDVLCHRWRLRNGNDIKLINADSGWLLKDSVLLHVAEDTVKSSKSPTFMPDKSAIWMHLGKYGGKGEQEKYVLRSQFDALFKNKSLEKKSSCVSITYMTSNCTSIGWPWELFMEEMLSALERHQVVVPLVVLEPCRQIFEKISTIIETYSKSVCQQSRIRIKVVKGQLADQKCDVIVNSTHERLLLSYGAVSSSILKKAGQPIQLECDEFMRHRAYISSTDVVVTKGHGLNCKHVFHGALASWKDQTLEVFVYNCLKEAEERKLSTIAFPSLGTGNLNYPTTFVTRTMFQTVQKYAQKCNLGHLKEVHFVIYGKDSNTLQEFLLEEKIQSTGGRKEESHEKCPNPSFIQITVTGENETYVDKTFQMIVKLLRGEKDKPEAANLTEPKQQEIPREVNPAIEARSTSVNEEREEEVVRTEIANWLESKETDCQTTTTNIYDGEQPDVNNKTDEECSVRVYRTDENAKTSINDFVETFGKYDIKKSQIVWCPYTPGEARVKLPNESGADSFIAIMELEKKYTVTKCSIEAVVNIRARLNTSISRYLEEESYINQLKNYSGVGIVKGQDGSVTLTGSLLEISAARCILLKWKTEFSVPRTKDTKYPVVDRNSCGDHITEIPKRDQQNALKNTIVVESSKVVKRTVIAKENSLLINFESSSADITEGEEAIHDNDESTKHKNVAGTESVVTTAKTSDSTINPALASSQNTSTVYMAEASESSDTPKETGQSVNPGYPSDESLMITTNEGIKIYVYKGDMRYLNVDGIVNSSNARMIHSKGLSEIISKAAGPKMDEACVKFLKDHSFLPEGQVFLTSAGNLKRYKGIIHVCSPVWDKRSSKDGFFNDLSGVIRNALCEANMKKMSSIAIPAVGSGGRGGPKQLCFSTYPNGIIEYSRKFGKTSKLKEVHLVDVNDEVVNFIRAACLLSITRPDKEKDRKLIQIPDSVKETFLSYIIKDETVDKQIFNMHLSNNVHVVVCDGALFSANNHRHIQMGACDVSYEFSAVVITEDVEFTGNSRSAQHCLQRGGNAFFKHYEDKKKNKEKKKVGKVYDTFGDQALNYGYVFYAVMPALSKKALETKSPEQLSFFRIVADCFGKVLIRADKWNISHLCLPVLGDDFFPKAEEYFMDKFVCDMFDELSGFASKRTTKAHLLIHIAVNTNKKLFQAFTEESDRRIKQKQRSSHPPGQIFQSGGVRV